MNMTGTGDLGRRLADHRERLGLTRDQLAERAGVSPDHVERMEERAVSPSADAVARLAGALEITVEELLGTSVEPPPGAAAPRLEVLEREECLSLIAPGGIGRVAFNGPYGPTVLPVNYRLHDGAILFRTAHGGPMDKDLRTGMRGVEIVVSFEVDRIDEERHEGWSVLIQGPFHHVSPEETAELTGSDVSPWAGGDRRLYIRIAPQRITGRRVHGL